MSPKTRNILLAIIGLVLGLTCVCVIGFLALGAISSEDPAVQASLQATRTAEALAAVASTQAAAVTPTLPAGATLIVDEAFDANNLNLNLYEESTVQTSLKDGTYQAHFGTWGSEITPIGKTLTNFIAELDCKPFGTKSICGIAFGIQPHEGNQLIPSYRIYLASDYGFDSIPVDAATYSFSNVSFARNSGDWNHIRVEVMNGVAKLYINKQFVDDFELNEPSLASGDVGILVGLAADADNGQSADLTVDNFKIWELP